MYRLYFLPFLLKVFVSCSDKAITEDNDSDKDPDSDKIENLVQDFNDNEINEDFWSRTPKGTYAWNMYMSPLEKVQNSNNF